MNRTSHCDLCDFQNLELKRGSVCELTDRKPEFNRTCTKIKLSDKFQNKVKEVNVNFEIAKQKRILTYIYFVVFMIIGISVIIGGYYLGKFILEKGVLSALPIFIMAIGLAPLAMGFGALNKFNRDLKKTKERKKKVDEVIHLYNIRYDIKIEFGKEIHGTQEVYCDLNLKGM